MTDIALRWSNVLGSGDLAIDGADLARDDGLATAVIISLFTDRRVSADELPEGETDRRGWWGDRAADPEGDEIGSKLWLLWRRKREPVVLVEAVEYASEALAWMLEDGVVADVEPAAEWAGREEMTLRVAATLPDGARREFEFENVLGSA